jgi:hypothetical protein
MKNKLLLGALLISTASLFTACQDDKDSNPTLIQPTAFTLNVPAYANEVVDLYSTEFLQLTWSQPQYTADNAPINITYEVQVSPTGSFKVSTDQAEADEEGLLIADYAIINRTTEKCVYDLSSEDLDKALVKVAKWSEATVPAEQTAYIRINAYVKEVTKKHNAIASNIIAVKTAPYYIELKDAEPIMWYLVGNNIGNGAWSDKPGESSFPMFIKYGFNYDKVTGAGEITYLNYFDNDGWKIQPADFNWDYGFMNGGSANTAIYRNGSGDAGNIWCDPAGYYLVTVNTASNECSIVQQDITPAVYDQICIAGSFSESNWSDVNMVSVNKNTENHVWCYTLTVSEGSVEQIKFKVAGTWDTNWGFGANDGDINNCGKATNGGKNIGVGEGTWIIMFNDITGEFSIIPKK